MRDLHALTRKYQLLRPHLDEYAMRICAAADAAALGRGGVSAVARASKLSRTTIHVGLRELEAPKDDKPADRVRVRQPGGGRKQLAVRDPALLTALDRLIDPVTRLPVLRQTGGDPENPLRWTCKSTTRLAAELRRQGHRVSQRSVWSLLDKLDYSMQSNRKTREGASHPDRDAQFQHIAAKVRSFQARGLPVVSVDTKKKELIGRFRNGGREWQRKGQPEEVKVYDFLDKDLGKVVPYGVYDITLNQGWVSVGITHDTAEFAVATIRRWWVEMGHLAYPQAKQLLITADSGGSNGSRTRLWKVELQRLANDLKLTVQVCHFPPGTSKWNKIEHRMFSHISTNWRGRPLLSRAVVVNLIANTRTGTGLEVRAAIDENAYPLGRKISTVEMAGVRLATDRFHGEWNYRIRPQSEPRKRSS